MAESSSPSPTEEIVRLIKRLSAYVAFKMSSLFSTTSIRNLVFSRSLSLFITFLYRIWVGFWFLDGVESVGIESNFD